MEIILKFLRDPAWDGIAGVAAIVTLLFFIADRFSTGFRSSLEKFGLGVYKILKILAFAAYGAVWGIPLTIISASVGTVIDYLAPGNARIPGGFGSLLYSLSRIRFLVWGFNPDLSLIEFQFGALGLYGGALLGFLYFLYRALTAGIHFSSIPRWHHFIALFMLILVVFLGFANLVIALWG